MAYSRRFEGARRDQMIMALAAAFVGATPLVTSASRSSAGPASSTLDLANYRETFSETFRDKLDVTPVGPSRWIAHTPWSGDFGDARFADPEPDFPFRTGSGGLQIIARKGPDGLWASGLLSSVDPKGRGFSQAKGYFEARMRMPPGPGTWPAFWLVAHSDPEYHAEIDVVEYYGHGTGWYNCTLHLWPKSQDLTQDGFQKTISVPDHALVNGYHTYGVDIADDLIRFYLDRDEVARTPTPRAALEPMSILIDLALGSGWPINRTPNPSILHVDYVKAFQRKSADG